MRNDRLIPRADRERYRRDGFVVVPELLSPVELDDFLSHEPVIPSWGNGPQPLQRFRSEPHWHRLVSNTRIVAALSELLESVPHVVEAIYIPKFAAAGGGGSQGTAFHRDIDHIRVDPPTLIGCWIALVDTDLENGGLCVVPGSHLSEPPMTDETAFAAEGGWIENEMRDRSGHVWIDRFQSMKFSRLAPEAIEPLTVLAGGAVFFDGALVHGAASNVSRDRDRLVASLHYVAQGSWVFRTDIQETLAVV